MPKNRKRGQLAKTIRARSMPGANAPVTDTRTPWLLVVQGAEVDVNHHIVCEHTITIGRDPDVDLTLHDGSISRAHCAVEKDEETGRYLLVDLESTNGTSINGALVLDRAPLDEGDKIFLGSSVLRFSYADAVDFEYHERLEGLVSTDALTGLATRRQYDAVYAAAVAKLEDSGESLTVMVMDMDGLKRINDTHGHQLGGFAITEVGKLMQEVLGEYGHLARYGGDEFVACFANMDRQLSLDLAQELRRRVAGHEFVKDSIKVAPTLSIGVATFPGDTDNPSDLFNVADRALYAAKDAGRNRVAAADRVLPTEADGVGR